MRTQAREHPAPAAPAYVPRPRVDSHLDAVPSLPATLIIAPAGAGKTAAAAAWVARATAADPSLKVAWASGRDADAVAVQIEAMRCPEQPDGPRVVVIDDIDRLAVLSVQMIAGI